ncbi:MAG: FAD-dependent oxidoreductase [Nocardioidaceae bacterium]|nr:FAD-dependent oxidoreductase [Nocardioidaceae bacterium]
MAERLVVVGGDAAGMSAASTAKRRAGDALDVVVLERTGWTSYSACGIPYWVAGDVSGPDALVVRTPPEHRKRGIDVRTGVTATAIDLGAGNVTTRAEDGTGDSVGYDQLLLATGAKPTRPDVPGADAPGVHGVQTLDDGCRLLDWLGASDARRVVVVGGGYIGLEMAEACVRRGLDTTLVDLAEEPMRTLDADLGRRLRVAMEGMGITVVMGAAVEGFDTDDGGRVRAVMAGGSTYAADLVVLGIGVRPRTALADSAGIALGDSHGVRVEPSMRVSGRDEVWAGGDCVEVWDRVAAAYTHVALGTHANKQGRVAGLNITGGDAVFAGVVGTAVTKVCELEIGRTGLTRSAAESAGRDSVSATIDSTTRAGYFPGAEPMTVRLTAERRGGRLLGAQIVGGPGAAKRIDVCATALWAELTVSDLVDLDLAYAPPFSPVWDPVQSAARALLSDVH